MPGRLQDKVAIVTGAGSSGPGWGNGKATAVLFAREGARVLAVDADREALEETRGIIREEGTVCEARVADVTDATQVEDLVRHCVATFGRIDILHNNVGIVEVGGCVEASEASWDRVMDVNLKSMFLTCKAVLPHMEGQGRGAIVNISSIAGIGQSLQQEPAYAASKGAIRIFTKVTAAQHAKDRIRCNSVHPGPVDTEMFHSAFPDREVMERRLQRIPLGRMGTVAEIVSLVLYLASDDSAYMTGSELLIDGGAMAQ